MTRRVIHATDGAQYYQVVMPLVQGMVWTLLVAGWRAWNSSHHFSGQSVGARLRRWWWGVNNWKIPTERGTLKDRRLAEQVKEVG